MVSTKMKGLGIIVAGATLLAGTYKAGSYFGGSSYYDQGRNDGRIEALAQVQKTLDVRSGDFDNNGEPDIYTFAMGQPLVKFFGVNGPKGYELSRLSPQIPKAEKDVKNAQQRLDNAIKEYGQPGPVTYK